MGHLKAYYEQFIRLHATDWQLISGLFEPVYIRKKSIVTYMGSVEQYLYFIEHGIIRYYVPEEDGETTFAFCFEKSFAGAYDSLVSRTPAAYQVAALSDTAAWRISYENLQRMYTETAVGNTLGRLIAEKLYSSKIKRELSLLRYTATERYRRLFSEQPELISQIPGKYIASYIGVTPQALSRIRRQIN